MGTIDNGLIFILVGCDDNGIHTEAITVAENMCEACIGFAHQGMGPIKFIDVAKLLRDAGDINNGDLAILESADETNKIEVHEINRYTELVQIVDTRISDIASCVFNFGQFASGDAYLGEDHNNYVDGDSVSQWKIYQVDTIKRPGTPLVKIYPKRTARIPI